MLPKINNILKYLNAHRYNSDSLFNPPISYDQQLYKSVLCVYLKHLYIPRGNNPLFLNLESLYDNNETHRWIQKDSNDVQKWIQKYNTRIINVSEFIKEAETLHNKLGYSHSIRLVPMTTVIHMHNGSPEYINELRSQVADKTVSINSSQKLCKYGQELVLYKETKETLNNRNILNILNIRSIDQILEEVIEEKNYESLSILDINTFYGFLDTYITQSVPEKLKVNALDLYCHAIGVDFIEKPALTAIQLNLDLNATLEMIKNHTLSITSDCELPNLN